jgi:hypothetical protein
MDGITTKVHGITEERHLTLSVSLAPRVWTAGDAAVAEFLDDAWPLFREMFVNAVREGVPPEVPHP